MINASFSSSAGFYGKTAKVNKQLDLFPHKRGIKQEDVSSPTHGSNKSEFRD